MNGSQKFAFAMHLASLILMNMILASRLDIVTFFGVSVLVAMACLSFAAYYELR
jgi:hypothetical protein